VVYAQLAEDVRRLSERLSRAGIGHGSRVGLLLPNSAEYLALLFALGRTGAVNVPLNNKLLTPELAAIVGYTRPDLVVTDEALLATFRGALEETRVALLAPKAELTFPQAGHAPGHVGGPVSPQAAFQLRLTTGSTGPPKGVVLSHEQRVWLFLAMCAEFGLSPRDVTLSVGPLFNGTHMVLPMLSLCIGATACVLDRFDAQEAAETITRERVTATLMVPTMLHRLLEAVPERSAEALTLRVVLSGAAPLWTSTKEALLGRLGPVLFEFYGTTEAGGMVCALPPADQYRKRRSIGVPFFGAELRILDEAARPVKPGEIGRLFMRSPTMATEYFERPEQSARAFRNGWFTAEDLARQDDEQYYYLVGRAQDVIATGGYKVPAAEIEDVLHAHPKVDEAAVFGIPDAVWGELIAAAIVAREPVSEDEILCYCRDRLPTFKRLRRIMFMPALPKDPSGKVLRRVLRDPHWAGHEAQI
jgi:acyl-CoA synthetase (AMP-forming)/AMP-acid ligase II